MKKGFIILLSIAIFILVTYIIWNEIAPEMTPRKVFNVADYGAIANDSLEDTIPIQAAINDCIRHGGGSVRLDAGYYIINADTFSHSFFNRDKN